MQKKELTFDVVGTLRGVVTKFLPELVQKTRETLRSRDLKLFDYVFGQYYLKDQITGRWYDPYHILLSTCFAVRLVKTEKGISPLIVPGIIMHDIGYCAINLADLLSAETRITHMQEGAAISAEALVRVRGFNANEIGIIVGMVATHDNWILNIPIADSRLALTDADKIFVMSFISFYKDWVGGEGKNFSVEEFLDSRRHSFCEGKHSLSTKLSQQLRDKQFKYRQQEIQNNVLKDENSFRQYAEEHVRAELEAGRG